MSLLWADGFDHYGPGAEGLAQMRQGSWAHVGSGVQIMTTARTGTHSVRVEARPVVSNGYMHRVLPGTQRNELGIGLGVYLPTLDITPDTTGIFLLNETNVIIFSVVFMPDGSLAVKRGGSTGTSLGASDAGIIIQQSWQHIEIAMRLDTVVGWIEIRVEGVTVYRLEDVNTGDFGATIIRYGAGRNGSGVYYFDDIFAWDDNGDINNTFIGPARVLTLFAEADTEIKEWTVTGATDAVDAINEIPADDDVTYIEAADALDAIEFTMPALPPEIIGLPGIYIPAKARLFEAGLGRIRLSMIDSAQVEEAGEIALSPVYSYRGSVFETNPVTGELWTKDRFENARLRIVKTM